MNDEIKKYAKSQGVKMWEIADFLEINESVFSKKFRYEFSMEEKNHVVNAIDKIKEQHERKNNEERKQADD